METSSPTRSSATTADSLLQEGATYADPNAGTQACGQQNISQLERLISLGGGTVLALSGLSRGKLWGLGLLGLGAALIHRGVTGHCHGYQLLGINTAEQPARTAVPSKQGCQVERTITIQKPVRELYAFWRDVENLPQILRHIEKVKSLDSTHSEWTAVGPFNMQLHWQAEVFNEREEELIAWRSQAGGDIQTAGSIHFTTLPHDRGTKVTISLKYNPPAGKVGAKLADFFGWGLEQQIGEDLHRFKSLMETGEIATAKKQAPAEA